MTPVASQPEPARLTPTPSVVAAIDVGASAMRLIVAQYVPGQRPQVLEEASRGVLLGRDTFTAGRIAATTVDASVRALNAFRRMMDNYGVSRVRAVATSAVREAANADAFLDRIRVRTGIALEVIDGSEESRLTYLAVRDGLAGHAALKAPSALLVEVGGGSLDVTRLNSGQPVQAGIFPLGAIRLRQRLSAWHGSHEQRLRLLTGQIDNAIGEIVNEVPTADASHVIALGSDVRYAASRLVDHADHHVSEVPREAFLAFCDEIAQHDEDSLVAHFRLSPVSAETLVPAMLVYRALVLATAAHTVVVPDVSLRAGLLVDLVSDGTPEADFGPQVLASAAMLGARYRYDESHTRAVARLSTRLFDLLAAEHALSPRDRLLLEVAAMLHDIGTVREPARAPQAQPVSARGIGNLRPDARRHVDRGQHRTLPPARAAAEIAPRVHAPRSRRARAGDEDGGDAAGRQRARRRARAEGVRDPRDRRRRRMGDRSGGPRRPDHGAPGRHVARRPAGRRVRQAGGHPWRRSVGLMNDRFFNRELSWLAFNGRVFAEAADASNPLLERLRFATIVASNLDEFFMVRVAGLKNAIHEGDTRPDDSGLTPSQQLEAVSARANTMLGDLHTLVWDALVPALGRAWAFSFGGSPT